MKEDKRRTNNLPNQHLNQLQLQIKHCRERIEVAKRLMTDAPSEKGKKIGEASFKEESELLEQLEIKLINYYQTQTQ